jgi:hypothetical protein
MLADVDTLFTTHLKLTRSITEVLVTGAETSLNEEVDPTV